jgi:hypothetical protein
MSIFQKQILKYLLITVLMMAIAACGMGKGCDCPSFGKQVKPEVSHAA